jgi:hypothetical protein
MKTRPKLEGQKLTLVKKKKKKPLKLMKLHLLSLSTQTDYTHGLSLLYHQV